MFEQPSNRITYEGLVSDLGDDISRVLANPQQPSTINSPALVFKNLQERDCTMLVGFSPELWSRYLLDNSY
jgi:hypothetical protein